MLGLPIPDKKHRLDKGFKEFIRGYLLIHLFRKTCYLRQNKKSQNCEILRFAQDDKTKVQYNKTHPIHLSQTILNRLFGRVLKREGVNVSCTKHTEKHLFSYSPIHLFTSKKPPFDVFEFWISDNTDMVRPVKQSRIYTEDELEDLTFSGIAGRPCNKSSKQELNGTGCSWYALNNINPDDETKKYWDSLSW